MHAGPESPASRIRNTSPTSGSWLQVLESRHVISPVARSQHRDLIAISSDAQGQRMRIARGHLPFERMSVRRMRESRQGWPGRAYRAALSDATLDHGLRKALATCLLGFLASVTGQGLEVFRWSGATQNRSTGGRMSRRRLWARVWRTSNASRGAVRSVSGALRRTDSHLVRRDVSCLGSC